MKKILLPTLLLGLLTIGLLPAAAQEKQTPDQICEAAISAAQDPTTREFSAPEQVLEDGLDYQAIFCTDVGPVYVDLFEKDTPETVNSFVFLSQQGYYNNSLFHRVLPGFMAQGGDPVGNPAGTGGPGYEFKNETLDALVFDEAGKLAMANAGPDTNGSQFFITTANADFLNGGYTLFGKVITGLNNVDDIMLRDPQYAPPDAPATVLHTVVIISDPASVDPVDSLVEPATREEVEQEFSELGVQAAAMMDSFAQGLSTVMTVQEDKTVVLDTAEWVAQFPEDQQAALSDFFASYNHQFHATATVANSLCDLTVFPMANMSYGIDVYGTAEDAAAAFADENLRAIETAQGFSVFDQVVEGYQLFTKTDTACDTADLSHARGIWQVGRFVVTGDVIYQEGVFTEDPAEAVSLLISDFDRGVFDGALRTLLRPELPVE